MAYLIPAILLRCTLCFLFRIYPNRIEYYFECVQSTFNISAFSLLIQCSNMSVDKTMRAPCQKWMQFEYQHFGVEATGGQKKKQTRNLFLFRFASTAHKKCAPDELCMCVCVYMARSLLYGTKSRDENSRSRTFVYKWGATITIYSKS